MVRYRDAEQRFNRGLSLFMALGFAALLAVLASTGLLMQQGQRQSGWVEHTYQVQRQVSLMRLGFAEISAAYWQQRGSAPTARPSATPRAGNAPAGAPLAGNAALLAEATGRLGRAIDNLAQLTGDNPAQQARIVLLRAEAAQIAAAVRVSDTNPDALLAVLTAQQAEGDNSHASAGPGAGSIEQIGLAMAREEAHLLRIRTAMQGGLDTSVYVMLTIGAVLLVAVGMLSLLTVRRYTRALGLSQGELRALNEGLEDTVSARTRDLSRANDEIQRFAYIVSHDLRSPLVNVMGFTAELEAATGSLATFIDRLEARAPDLVDKEARLAAREDLPEAIRFIRSSTQKMDRLINAILRLSREGRRTLAPERVALAALAGQVVDAMRHRIDEAGATVLAVEPLGEVLTDRLALEQILSNLVENACKYLAPGRPGHVEIRARTQGFRVLIDVIDNGRGIEPRDHERIFDLFRRSGTQDQPGEGIGLAHVRALAYRLGGTITVSSRLGVGSTFTINLPATFTGEMGSTA